MDDVKVDLNIKGLRELLRDPKVTGLQRRADAIADRAGPGHEVQVTIGRTRARASIRTATPEAMGREATTRNLTSALDAGR